MIKGLLDIWRFIPEDLQNFLGLSDYDCQY